MAERKSRAGDQRGSATGFTAEERAAMRERAKELKAAEQGREAEQALLDKIAELPPDDKEIAENIHRIVRSVAPGLAPRTYYGMPAYAKDGAVLCFFQPADKFKARYGTLGFNDAAALDDGDLWPTSYAVTTWNPAVEERITQLIIKAAG